MRSITVYIFLVTIPMCILSAILLKKSWKHKINENRDQDKYISLFPEILSLMSLSIAGAITTGSVKTGLTIIMILTFLAVLKKLGDFKDIKKRRNIVSRELPLLLDFLVLQVESGYSILQAFKFASLLFPEHSPVHSGLHKFQEKIRLGSTVQIALEELGEFLDTTNSRTALHTISQAIKHGTPLGEVLRNQANRIREQLVIEGEKFAHTLSVKLLIPLLFFIFPASFLVIFSPVIVSLAKILQ